MFTAVCIFNPFHAHSSHHWRIIQKASRLDSMHAAARSQRLFLSERKSTGVSPEGDDRCDTMEQERMSTLPDVRILVFMRRGDSLLFALAGNGEKNEQHTQRKENKQISMPREKAQTAQESEKTQAPQSIHRFRLRNQRIPEPHSSFYA
jgi:hypothetical protein